MADPKEKKKDVAAMSPTEMMQLPDSELKVERATRSKVDYNELDNDKKQLIARKMRVNASIVAAFKNGKRDDGVFFVIDQDAGDEGDERVTATFTRKQEITFTKKGEVITDFIIGFTKSGTGKKMDYIDGDGKEIAGVLVSGISAITKEHGSVSLNNL